MEGSGKGSSPLKSTGENNENDSSQDKMIPKFQNHKKTVAKHFMSPTISAASKAAPPRKKILAERNENLSLFDSQNQRTSNLDLKKSPRNSSISHFDRSSSSIVSPCKHASEPHDDGDTKFEVSPVKGYDPLNNFLSPRPKYLRFNPNRRVEIFRRLENKGREELNSSFDSVEVNDEEEIKESSFSPLKESVVKLENEENSKVEAENVSDDYEDEEEEEVEEQRGWCLRGLLKLVLTLIACLLSTSYICSMNSPTPSPTQQSIWSLRDGYFMLQKQALEVISMKMHDIGNFLEVGEDYGETEAEIDVDDNEEIEESIEAEMVENLENETEDNKNKIDEISKVENVIDGGFESQVQSYEQLIDAETEESSVDDCSFCLDEDNVDEIVAEETEVARVGQLEKQLVGNEDGDSKDKIDEAKEVESVGTKNFEQLMTAAERGELIAESSYPGMNEDNVDEMEVSGTKVVGGIEAVVSEKESFEQLIDAKTDESEDVDEYEPELSVKSIPEKEARGESKGVVDNIEPSQELSGLQEKLTDFGHEVDEMGYDDEIEMEKMGLSYASVIGLSAVSLVLSSLAILVRHLKKSRNAYAEESKPYKFAVEEKKVTPPAVPTTERKVEFLARPSFSHPVEEPSRKFHAPNVELIGEIVVGQASGFENFGSPVSALIKPSALEHSTIGLPSYGSLVTETKTLKIEGEQSKEAMFEVTSLRRSSRLRNRAAIKSP